MIVFNYVQFKDVIGTKKFQNPSKLAFLDVFNYVPAATFEKKLIYLHISLLVYFFKSSTTIDQLLPAATFEKKSRSLSSTTIKCCPTIDLNNFFKSSFNEEAFVVGDGSANVLDEPRYHKISNLASVYTINANVAAVRMIVRMDAGF